MKINDIVAESIVQVWSRTKAGKMVRKYRCTAGPRKGRIVSSPSVCSQPKRLSSVFSLKKAKARRGATMRVKAARTKRASGVSVRLGNLNRQRAGRVKSTRHGSRRSGRKSIRN